MCVCVCVSVCVCVYYVNITIIYQKWIIIARLLLEPCT